jgi:hypothetical protein
MRMDDLLSLRRTADAMIDRLVVHKRLFAGEASVSDFGI